MNYIFTAILAAILLQLSGCYYQGQSETCTALENANPEANYISTTSELPGTTVFTPQVITPQEAELMMTGENVIVLDVRTRSEFEEGHIKNAILLPVNEIQQRAEAVIPNKNYTVLIYCRSGNRSNQAAFLLSEMGYISVYDFGGIIDWHGEVIR